MPPEQDDDALLRWATHDGMPAVDIEPAPAPQAPPQIAVPPAPVGYVNAWDTGLNRYILMPAATRSAPAPLRVSHPADPSPSNPPGGMGRVIPFRPQANMLVKQAGVDPYDKFVQSIPEIPIPNAGGTDGMAGNYDPELTAEIAQVQSEIRSSTPGMTQGFNPMEGDGHEAVGDLNYPNGSASIKDLPR